MILKFCGFLGAEKSRFNSGETAFDSVRFDDVWSNGEGPEGPVGGENAKRLFVSTFLSKVFRLPFHTPQLSGKPVAGGSRTPSACHRPPPDFLLYWCH